MPLWLIEREDKEVGWDESAGFVVRADTEQEARALIVQPGAQQGFNYFADEGPDVWLDSLKAKATQLLDEGGAPGIILWDFKAG